MKFKIIKTNSNSSYEPEWDIEELVNESLKQGWKLYGNTIIISRQSNIGEIVEIYQPMIFED